MKMTHIPYGYIIKNGVAEIDPEKGEQIKKLFAEYLGGKSIAKAGESAGIPKKHPSLNNYLSNKHYIGDDYFPAIIDEETFKKAQMRKKYRALVMGRTGERPERIKKRASVEFDMKKANRHYDDPFEQAEYTYSRIRSKDER